MQEATGPPRPIASPISEFADGLFKADERELFYAALDELPNFDDVPATPGDQYEIEEDDWQWLTKQVSNDRSTAEVVLFAQSEYDKMQQLDPELVRRAPTPLSPACDDVPRRRGGCSRALCTAVPSCVAGRARQDGRCGGTTDQRGERRAARRLRRAHQLCRQL